MQLTHSKMLFFFGILFFYPTWKRFCVGRGNIENSRGSMFFSSGIAFSCSCASGGPIFRAGSCFCLISVDFEIEAWILEKLQESMQIWRNPWTSPKSMKIERNPWKSHKWSTNPTKFERCVEMKQNPRTRSQIPQKHELALKMGPPEAKEHEKAIRLQTNWFRLEISIPVGICVRPTQKRFHVG